MNACAFTRHFLGFNDFQPLGIAVTELILSSLLFCLFDSMIRKCERIKRFCAFRALTLHISTVYLNITEKIMKEKSGSQ